MQNSGIKKFEIVEKIYAQWEKTEKNSEEIYWKKLDSGKNIEIVQNIYNIKN